MAVKAKKIVGHHFEMPIVEFEDGHKATFIPVTGGFGGDMPSMAGFRLEFKGKTVAMFHTTRQRPSTLSPSGFQKVADNYKGYSAERIAEYWEVAAAFVTGRMHQDLEGPSRHLVVNSGRYDLADIKQGKHKLPTS